MLGGQTIGTSNKSEFQAEMVVGYYRRASPAPGLPMFADRQAGVPNPVEAHVPRFRDGPIQSKILVQRSLRTTLSANLQSHVKKLQCLVMSWFECSAAL
jgi:hypothetical protein